jgi:hypothetical protein
LQADALVAVARLVAAELILVGGRQVAEDLVRVARVEVGSRASALHRDPVPVKVSPGPLTITPSPMRTA